MIRLRKVALIAALSIGTASWALPLAAQNADACTKPTLPEAVSQLLKAKFPTWRPKQLSDLDADDQQLWLKAHDKQCPGVAVGHFERPDQAAYALLLVPITKPTGGYKLVVLNKSEPGNGYTATVVDHAEGQTYSGLVINFSCSGKVL